MHNQHGGYIVTTCCCPVLLSTWYRKRHKQLPFISWPFQLLPFLLSSFTNKRPDVSVHDVLFPITSCGESIKYHSSSCFFAILYIQVWGRKNKKRRKVQRQIFLSFLFPPFFLFSPLAPPILTAPPSHPHQYFLMSSVLPHSYIASSLPFFFFAATALPWCTKCNTPHQSPLLPLFASQLAHHSPQRRFIVVTLCIVLAERCMRMIEMNSINLKKQQQYHF